MSEPVAWRYRHPLNKNLWVVVAGPDWPERDKDMEPLYTADAHETLVSALKAAEGYLLNAKIDLETGAKKATAINTIGGGLRTVAAALASHRSPVA